MKYDFSGWATRNDLLCSDGLTIKKDAFKQNDGATVPLVWDHKRENTFDVLGHAVLENRDEGVYAYCSLNETESGKNAKMLVEHGDVSSLSIFANQLKKRGSEVLQGNIREVSLVLAGANPGAFVDTVITHSDSGDKEEGIIVGFDENVMLYHSDDDDTKVKENEEGSDKKDNDESIGDIINTMSEKQKDAMYYIVSKAIDGDFDEEGDDEAMKHNIFEDNNESEKTTLSHSDMQDIISLAKMNNVGNLQTAIKIYAEENDTLQHGIDDIETLFPEYKDVYPGAPEMITRDQTWIDSVLSKIHKSPISRIRTRQADVRIDELRGLGYTKGKEKQLTANIKLLKRTTEPQTVYIKDKMERDDIVDITDFDVVDYQYKVMRMALNEELARAILIGDGREEGDEQKISEEHIRSIWKDDELYTIHADVDYDAAAAELQGTNTGANFGENYIKAEATISAALYAREQYKGSGSLEYYCTPHSLNVMLLARDLNGRRIYNSKTDLAAALDVSAIHTVEQFEGQTRTTDDGDKKLVGIFVNLSDYQVGSAKGGEITKFEDFDIDFNHYKYLIETRVSGALTKPYSAIVLEEPVTSVAG